MDVLKEPENQLTVQVWATGLVDVFGLAFHLRYNPKILQYLEGTTYPILVGGAETKESRRLIRHDPGRVE